MSADELRGSPTEPATCVQTIVRCVALFVAGYTINGTLHEWTHALTARALGVPATIFHFYANIDEVHATDIQLALIAVTGPLFSLALGTAFWLAFKRGTAVRRPLFFYLATFGINIFLGNLASISFVGDFSRAARLLGVPVLARHAITGCALLSLAVFMFWVGRELRDGVPSPANSLGTALCLVVLPTLIGTALVIVIYLPMPPRFISATAGSSAVWLFTAIGVFARRTPSQPPARAATVWLELVVAALAALAVRALIPGVQL